MDRIMIDMDDVMVKGGRLYLINKYLGTHYTEDDFKSYYMQSVIPDKEDFFKWFVTQNQYDYCTIEPHAREVIKRLIEYYKVYIGTSYLFPEIPKESGIILLQKYFYLLEKFPYLTPNNLVFLTDKSVLDCEIKIDDVSGNLSGAKRKLLYTAYHNKAASDLELRTQGIERVNDWLEIDDLLLRKKL